LPYQGKAAAQEHEVRRGKAKEGTTHFHRYGTLAIVHHHRRYTLALTFVWAEEKMEEVVARLLDRARALGLCIRRAYLDKGFCSTAVLRLLRRRHLC
jgi:putative transposase